MTNVYQPNTPMRLPVFVARLSWCGIDRLFRPFVDTEIPDVPTPPRIGLALSCGSARGLAHIGVIQVLEEENFPITAIIGSSMGAYVGALWASGISGKELETLAAEIKDRRALRQLLDANIPPLTGFIQGHKVRKRLEQILGETTIEQLKRPMYIVASNLDTVSGEILPPYTPVAAAIHASCAIPGIVSPVILNGKRYIDGGASQPLPVSLLKQQLKLDAVIAVNVMPTYDDIATCDLKCYPVPPESAKTSWGQLRTTISRNFNLFAYGNVLDTFKRCLTSAQMRLTAEESQRANVVIHPFFCGSTWYDFERFDDHIKAGRAAARAKLPQLRTLLQPSTYHIE